MVVVGGWERIKETEIRERSEIYFYFIFYIILMCVDSLFWQKAQQQKKPDNIENVRKGK